MQTLLLLLLSKSLSHLSFFRNSRVRACDGTTKFRPFTTPLLTNHRTADHSNVDVIGWKKCRWSKFRHTGVRSYVGNTKGTQTILDWKVSLWQNTSWPWVCHPHDDHVMVYLPFLHVNECKGMEIFYLYIWIRERLVLCVCRKTFPRASSRNPKHPQEI